MIKWEMAAKFQTRFGTDTDSRGGEIVRESKASRLITALLLALSLGAAFGATNKVLNLDSFGVGSLRQAVINSLSGDTIVFDPSLAGQTILLTNGEISLNKSLIIDASALPGGVRISGGQTNRIFEVVAGAGVTLRSLTIRDGYAPSGTYPANAGGGILNRGSLTVTNCTILNNQAAQGTGRGGGGIANYEGTLVVHSSTITGNSSETGGGIENYVPGGYAGSCTLNQCTVAGNSASSYGGGIYNYGNFNLNQSTVTGNASTLSGGGVMIFGTLLTSFNSIVAGNSTGPSGNANITGAYATAGVNLTSGDPLLGPLAYNGGPTPTMLPRASSPALDAGAPTSFTTDQRGLPRLFGAAVDIGAVEVQETDGLPVPPLLTSVTWLGGGGLRFSFTNVSGTTFSVWTSTNLAWPLNAWSNLGPAVETPSGSGQFQFTDTQATNLPLRFYRVRSP